MEIQLAGGYPGRAHERLDGPVTGQQNQRISRIIQWSNNRKTYGDCCREWSITNATLKIRTLSLKLVELAFGEDEYPALGT